MTKIHILGSSSGIPTKKRNTESVALVVGKDIYLLDGGEPCSASLIRNNINYNKIKTIFISHMHADHFNGIPMLIQTMQLAGKYGMRKDNLKLFIPGEAINGIKKYLATVYLMNELLPFKLQILPIKNGPVSQDGNINFSACPNKHLKSALKTRKPLLKLYPDIQMQSYSFFIKIKDKKIVYSGDLMEPGELEGMVDGIDLLLCEMAHFQPEELFKFLARKQISRIILLHIHPNLDDKEQECLKIARSYLGNRVSIAFDGMEIKL